MGLHQAEFFKDLFTHEVQKEPPITASPYDKLGLLENPFPARAHPLWRRFHNQEEVRDKFNKEMEKFVRSQCSSTFLLLGGNRVGKTHFLKHNESVLREISLEKKRPDFVPIYISATAADFSENYSIMLESLNTHYFQIIGESFLLTFISKLHAERDTFLNRFLEDDFIRALKTFKASNLEDRYFEERLTALKVWLGGGTLQKRQKDFIKVYSSLKSNSAKIRTFSTLIRIARHFDLLRGVILFLDELEQLWVGKRPDKRLSYLINLRQLIDELPDGLFFVIALSDDREDNLRRDYVPLYKRLTGGYEVNLLRQIQSVDDAWGYVEHFLEEARRDWKEKLEKRTKKEYKGEEIFSRRDVEKAVKEFGTPPIPQGDLFDKLHQIFEERVLR